VTESGVTQYFAQWRGVSMGRREIVEGLVRPEHAGPSPALAAALADFDGQHYWDPGPDGHWLVLVREQDRKPERWWLHALLFAVTLITMMVAGSSLSGVLPETWQLPSARTLLTGLPFALPLAAILLAHESGHYVAARRYRVDSSPPFFLPFPPQLNVLGTMGAFIRLRSAIFDRRTLFDIGVAGPLAGAIIAIPVLAVGLAQSTVTSVLPPVPFARQFLLWGPHPFYLGDSLLLLAIRAFVAPHGVLQLSPMAVAGWAGLLITMLNLLPLAQLDGGHVTFAMFGRTQRWIARATWLALLPLGYYFWPFWWVWAAIGLIVGRGRLAHPRVLAPERPLSNGRRWLGAIAILLFVATFMPLPVHVPLFP
jgi:membrane-associated protease RseP (regulator of RpoE activity)